jgi:hypothetical protein
MAGYTGAPPIVTDGLVFALDAANYESYTSGSNTWYDVVGGNNSTLVNGPTFNRDNSGNIDFDGANDYATIGYTMPPQDSTTSFTWLIWIYLLAGNGGNDVIFGNRYGPANLQFIKITPTQWEYYNNSGDTIGYNDPTEQWVNLCVVKNQGTHYYYSNASQIGTKISSKSIVANPIFMAADAYSGVQEAARVKFAVAMI